MSTTLAIILVSALHLVVAAPLVAGFFSPRLKWAAGGLYLVMTAGIAAYHLEISAPELPPFVPPIAAIENPQADPRCEKALSLAEQAGLILERETPERIVVEETLWAQVPEEIRDALLACHSGADPSLPAAVEPEVVKRRGNAR